MQPKSVVDVMKCEVAKFYKLTAAGQVVPIRFEVPRANLNLFHDDLFPGIPLFSSFLSLLISFPSPLFSSYFPPIFSRLLGARSFRCTSRCLAPTEHFPRRFNLFSGIRLVLSLLLPLPLSFFSLLPDHSLALQGASCEPVPLRHSFLLSSTLPCSFRGQVITLRFKVSPALVHE